MTLSSIHLGRIRRGAILLCGGVTLSACGTHTPPRTVKPGPTVWVHWSAHRSVDALALDLAVKLQLFAHIQVKTTPRIAPITMGAPGQHWPIVAVLSQRPDAYLVAPIPDPHFRLRALSHLPVYYSQQEAINWPLNQRILHDQRAIGVTGHPLPFSKIQKLWKQRHLPWVIVTLRQWLTLKQSMPHSVVLAWLGASSGPIYQTVVTAPKATPHLAAVLRGLDLALWYIHTTPARNVATILSPVVHQPLAQVIEEIRIAKRQDYWPPTVVPSGPAYFRTETLWQDKWPAYTTGVSLRPSLLALSSFNTTSLSHP